MSKDGKISLKLSALSIIFCLNQTHNTKLKNVVYKTLVLQKGSEPADVPCHQSMVSLHGDIIGRLGLASLSGGVVAVPRTASPSAPAATLVGIWSDDILGTC